MEVPASESLELEPSVEMEAINATISLNNNFCSR
jgi:hypothetical protein